MENFKQLKVSEETANYLEALHMCNKANDCVLGAMQKMYGEERGDDMYIRNIEPKYKEYKIALYEYLSVALEQDLWENHLDTI